MYGTPKDVIDLTGITPDSLGLDEQLNPQAALDSLLTVWIDRISIAINARLTQGRVLPSDPNYKGIIDVSVRTVAKLVAVAVQQRTSPIVQVNEFAVNVINTTQVIKDLDEELKPYQKQSKTRFSFYSSTK